MCQKFTIPPLQKKDKNTLVKKLVTWSLGGLFLSCAVVAMQYLTTSARSSEGSANKIVSAGNIDGGIPLASKERGKPVSEQINADELYEAYESIRNEYDQKAFQCNSEKGTPTLEGMTTSECHGKWKTLKEIDGIEVSMLNHPSDPACPYVRISAVMPGNIDSVWNFMRLENWENTMPKMDPFYESLDIVKNYAYKDVNSKNKKKTSKLLHKSPSAQHHEIEMVLARKKTNRLITFGKRDFTFVQVSDLPREDGVWVSGTVSVVTDRLPRVKGYTRAFQDSVAFYKPVNNGADTKLTLVFRIDLNDSAENGAGGAVPMWLYVKTIGSTGVLIISNIKKELIKGFQQNKKQQLKEALDISLPRKKKKNPIAQRVGKWFARIRKNKQSVQD